MAAFCLWSGSGDASLDGGPAVFPLLLFAPHSCEARSSHRTCDGFTSPFRRRCRLRFLLVQSRVGEGRPVLQGIEQRSIVLDRRDLAVLGGMEMWALNPQTHGSFWPGNGLLSKAHAQSGRAHVFAGLRCPATREGMRTMSQNATQRRRHGDRRGRDHPARDRADRINREAGQRLRVLRRAVNMTQSQLGERVGVSFQQIQKYEKGATGIKIGTAVVMAEALGIGLGDLVGSDVDTPSENALLENLGRLTGQQRRVVDGLIRSMLNVTSV